MVLIQSTLLNFESKMVVQVHDELVFDVHPSEYDELIPILVDVMEQSIKLSLPLVVDVESGPSWGQISG